MPKNAGIVGRCCCCCCCEAFGYDDGTEIIDATCQWGRNNATLIPPGMAASPSPLPLPTPPPDNVVVPQHAIIGGSWTILHAKKCTPLDSISPPPPVTTAAAADSHDLLGGGG
jgi:hypothetical protein